MRSLIPFAIALLLAGGCATQNQSGTQNTDRAFGNAVNAAKAMQVVDPDAPSKARGPLGSDGEQAVTSVGEYEKSYLHPVAPTSILNIGVGSTTSASTSNASSSSSK